MTGPVDRIRNLFAVFDLGLAFVAILVSTDIFNRFGINSPVWLLVYALVLGRIVLVWRTVYRLFARNLPYFVYPALCFASAIWSVLPAETLRTAFQLTMTLVIAMFIGIRFPLRTICLVQLYATFTGVFLSLVNLATGVFGPVYAGSGGLLGVFTQKNMLGQRALYTAFSIVVVVLAPMRGGGLFKLALLGCFSIVALMLALSLSVTVILLVPLLIGLLLAMNHRLVPRSATALALLAGVALTALVPLVLVVLGIDPVADVLQAFGKNSSLTGRTELWDMAARTIADYPLLGVGYGAFWEAPRFANYALFAQQVGGEKVAGFHNFVFEVWVGNGVVGLAAMAVLIGTSLWRAARLWLATRSPFAAYAFVGTLAGVVLSLLSTGLYRQHEYIIMFIVMVGVAAGREFDALAASAPTPSRRRAAGPRPGPGSGSRPGPGPGSRPSPRPATP